MQKEQLKPGELMYDGERVDAETFSAEGKNLSLLIGRCSQCSKLIYGSDALPEPDPFAEEIHDDTTPVVQCNECKVESALDI